MGQMKTATAAIKLLFDKSNRREQILEFERDKELFQAARTFYNAIRIFEGAQPAKSQEVDKSAALEAKKRQWPASSQARHARGGKGADIPVIVKQKKKIAIPESVEGAVGSHDRTSDSEKEFSKCKACNEGAVSLTASRAKKNRLIYTMCIKCGRQVPNISAHVCTHYPDARSGEPSKTPTQASRRAREKEETKRPRRTLFDKSTSGTLMSESKYVGATAVQGMHNVKRHKALLAKIGGR